MALDENSLTTTALVAVLGAGPAGLTAAAELVRREFPVLLLEQDRQIGGLARTVSYKDCLIDVGGHRFVTRLPEILSLWQELLGEDLLLRPRLSRICYHGRLFAYPLRPVNTLRNLGMVESFRILTSYLQGRLSPVMPEQNLADWITNRFGRRFYELFFQSYMEKVWGVPCNRIAGQLLDRQRNKIAEHRPFFAMLFPGREGEEGKTPTDQFWYPRRGPGMMWDALVGRIRAGGGELLLERPVVALHHNGRRILSVEAGWGEKRISQEVASVISTLPLRSLIRRLRPQPPEVILAAAERLRYRDFLTVALVVDQPELFPDNWLYIHDPEVRVGRIVNYRNWSAELVPDRERSCLGLEYYCTLDDELWSMADGDLVTLAAEELAQLGLAPADKVVDGMVIRMAKACPVYDEGYGDALERVRGYLGRFVNLQTIGRNGMHRCYNMDHAMLTALRAAANLAGEQHDLCNLDMG